MGVVIECHEVQSSLADDVREGLARTPRELPPKLFYDERGSELFDRITSLPEYYPTRCEREILNRHAPTIVERAGAEELVELGSGTASKTRALLYAMAGQGSLERYVPFDVDESVVHACAAELTEIYPGLDVHGLVGDFGRDLERIPSGHHRLFAFLGGTIGNLYPAQRARFLGRLRRLMGAGDRLVIGTDLVKDRAVLEAAYNDSAGVTGEFNRNVLRVVNAGLDADFRIDAFEHSVHVEQREPSSRWTERSDRSPGRARSVRRAGAPLALLERHGARRYRRGLDDRGCRLPIGREAVDHFLEVDHVADPEAHEVAVVARDAVALDDLGGAPGELGHLLQLPRRRPDAQHHAQRVAERARVELGAVARDRTGLLEPREPVRHRGGGEADAAAELGVRQAGVGLDLLEQGDVDAVQAVLPSIRSHYAAM